MARVWDYSPRYVGSVMWNWFTNNHSSQSSLPTTKISDGNRTEELKGELAGGFPASLSAATMAAIAENQRIAQHCKELAISTCVEDTTMRAVYGGPMPQ